MRYCGAQRKKSEALFADYVSNYYSRSPGHSSLWMSGRVGLVVRALAFHQCGPGSISALGVICGLSLLVLYSAMRGFSPGCSGFPLSSKTNI